MKKISNNTILIIVLSIVFGFLSGILGYTLAGGLPLFGQFNLADADWDRQIVIDQPRNVVVEQDIQLKQIENDLLPTLVNIYFEKKTANVLSQAYLFSEYLGQGFILTADGWVVTSKNVITNIKNKYVAVGYRAKQYELGNFIEDRTTGIIFAKIPASGLAVAKLGKSKELAVGQTVVVASERHQLTLAHIRKIGYDFKVAQDIVQSSEKLNKQLFLDLNLDNSFNGAIVANFKGEVVGVVNGGRVIMIDYFKNIISQVLKSQKIVRPILGLSYIDLVQVNGLINQSEKGALVYGNPLKTGPAFNKLRDGDIIKKVDDVEINAYQSLSELLNGYKSGSQVEFLFQRGEQEERVEVILQ